MNPITPPSTRVAAAARERLEGLAIPPGALGRLGDLAVWLCAAQGQCPPRPVADIRLVVFAGDHGIARYGVSAYPPAVTAAMVRTIVAEKAGVSALARAHGVRVRVLDIGVDAELDDLSPEVTAHKVRRSSGALHLVDALTTDETTTAVALGRRIALEEIADGAQMLISGDLGIGNTTPAACLVAAVLGLGADEVVGRGTGIDDMTWAHKRDLVTAGLARAGDRVDDPLEALTALGSADLAATVGYLLAAARSGTPVLLDGLMALACALIAERIAPDAATWFIAGHRSTEPAQAHALKALGLEPLLDLGMRLGEGSGAVAAVPMVRSAVALLRDVALLSEIM